MDWKKFFKPSWSKVGITILIFFLGQLFVSLIFPNSCPTPWYIDIFEYILTLPLGWPMLLWFYVYSLISPITGSSSMTGAPVHISLFWFYIPAFLFLIIYSYILSCLMMFKKVFKWLLIIVIVFLIILFLNMSLSPYCLHLVPKDGCAETSMKIRNIGDVQACYGGSGQNGYINFFIDNTGNKDIEGLEIAIIGEKGTKLLDLDLTISKGELLGIKYKSVTYDFDTYGLIKEIRFYPKVKVEDSVKTCDTSISAEKLKVC